MTEKHRGLKKRILEEMTADYSNALEKNFDLAKQFMMVTKEGKVDVLIKENISGKEQLLVYLIGKLYANKAGLSATDDVGNKELMDELGIPPGSVLPWLKYLRDENKIKQVKRGKNVHHAIPISMVEKTLIGLEKKLKKSL